MDSQITQITQNTSTDKHEEYLKMYQEFLLDIVELNNLHDIYHVHRGYYSGRQVRVKIGEMLRSMRKMQKAHLAAYEEERNNKLIRRDNRKALRQHKIENKKLEQTPREIKNNKRS